MASNAENRSKVAAGPGARQEPPKTSSSIPLTMAVTDSDHVRDLSCGLIEPAGVALSSIVLPVHEIFGPFLASRQWDVAEMSLAKYASLVSQGDDSLVGLPVFPSRAFRHSSVFVRREAVARPEDLRGRRVGIPEWAQTAGVYVRGFLQDGYGIGSADVAWSQGGVNQPGRLEKVRLRLPPGVVCTPVGDRSLNQMLLDGTLDALISAEPPAAFTEGGRGIVHLFADLDEAERGYWDQERIFPIMHLITLRRDVYERAPWVAASLTEAFEEAKRRSLERVFDVSVSRFPLPWVDRLGKHVTNVFQSPDPWQYGLEPNRRTLETFLRLAFEQGVTHRRLTPEELFPSC